MILTLEVTGPKAANLGALRRKEFRREGGTIGRLPDNDWVLPDPYISARHARVQFRNGAYFLEDTSTNGVSVNSPDNRLQRGKPYALQAGDCIFIDAFEIRVGFIDEHVAAEPFIPARLEGIGAGRPAMPSIPDDPFAVVTGEQPFVGPADGVEVDPLKLVGGESRRPPRVSPVPKVVDLAAGSPLEEHYRPPEIVAPLIPEEYEQQPEPASQSGMIPADFDPFAPDELSKTGASHVPREPAARASAPQARPAAQSPLRPAPAPPRPATAAVAAVRVPAPALTPASAPSPSPGSPGSPGSASESAPGLAPARAPPSAAAPHAAPAPPVVASVNLQPAQASTDIDFANLLEGAGLRGVAVSPELARNFGEILRVVITGLMELLRARERTKDEFRMRLTTFRPADNNPLKFSANVEDALHNLLVKRNPAYLAPVDAFEDAFRDVRDHQMATLAGVRIAFDFMLREFDPARLQETFDREIGKGGFLGAPARLKYWDLYRERFRDTVKDADSCFRELFGDQFAKAYQEQLEKLRDAPRTGDR